MMKSTVLASLVLVITLLSACFPGGDLDARLRPLVKDHIFSIATWELRALLRETERLLASPRLPVDDEVALVIRYFEDVRRIEALEPAIRAARDEGKEAELLARQAELIVLRDRQKNLAAAVERILERQIKETLSQQGIYNPLVRTNVSFPPLNFSLEQPPYLLVISPRHRIESVREITLNSDLATGQIEAIESIVDDELDVSSLVVGLGGLGATYPTLVDNRATLKSALDIAAEEWLHQYLALTPLGFRYLLDVSGLSRNYDIATMNETVAGMVSQEIGDLVYQKYYSGYRDETEAEQPAETEFDFDREMREIRQTVDGYLSRGEIETAEKFMVARRRYLESNGYYIRKLNQAYFAFHGIYADEPAFISPIGLELKELRESSASLKDFLDTVANMNSRRDLSDSLLPSAQLRNQESD